MSDVFEFVAEKRSKSGRVRPGRFAGKARCLRLFMAVDKPLKCWR